MRSYSLTFAPIVLITLLMLETIFSFLSYLSTIYTILPFIRLYVNQKAEEIGGGNRNSHQEDIDRLSPTVKHQTEKKQYGILKRLRSYDIKYYY